MERATSNIKDPRVRAYFEAVTDGKEPTEKLSPQEYEDGIIQFDLGLRRALREARHLF